MVARSIRRSQDYFRATQHTEGYWCGELESNPTMEAEYLMLSQFLGRVDRERWRKIANYILSKQSDDGSWGQYYQAPGDLSTSVECYFALKLAGCRADSEPLEKARRFILSRGGVPKVRIFTKIWLALFGQWDWRGTPNMPPELIFLPSWMPFNIYRFASWVRATIVPMIVILTRHPVSPVRKEASIDELYPKPRRQIDYSIPMPADGWGWAWVLHGLDCVIGLYERLPIHPFRKLAERKIARWILGHQEEDGCWAGIQPPWVYSLIALHYLGFPPDHPAIEKGFAGFERYVIENEDTCSLQACMSPVWDTCLAQIALLDSGVTPDDPMIRHSTEWLVSQQIMAGGDWQVQARNVPPGGWAFEFNNDRYPDIDDTSEVIMALEAARLEPESQRRSQEAIQRGVTWLSGLQCKNGGWAAFDKDNDAKYLTKLPFSDFGEVVDPPSADVTAHIVEMFGKLGYGLKHPPVRRAYQYLRREQEVDGSWFGRWGVNYIYGVGAVLPALAQVGEDMNGPHVRRAVDWLISRQNPDGGWGESCGSYVDPSLHGVGASTASQTAWALLALIAAGDGAGAAAAGGVNYLVSTQDDEGCWDEPYFTGTGFPGYGVGGKLPSLPKPGDSGYQGLDMPAGFMINYHLYRNYWPLTALGRYAKLFNITGNSSQHRNGVSKTASLGHEAISSRKEGERT